MQINRRTLLTTAAGLACGGSLPAWAQLRIEITGVGANQMPIAIPQFQGTNNAPVDLSAVISADLERSGAFRSIKVMGELPPEDVEKPRAKFWRTMGATALVIGTIEKLVDTRYRINYKLFGTVENKIIDENQYVVSSGDLRLTAHRIADAVYEQLTGESGIFASRLAYVLQRGPSSYELVVSDSDGENPQTALRSNQSIISPMWSPNGLLLTYVSFEANKPVIYLHDVRSGERRLIASFKGNNSAPAFSPDGKTMAVALSMDAFAVAVASGCSVRTVSLRQYLRVGGAFGLFQCLMPLGGWILGSTVHRYIEAWDHWLAFGLLAWVGGNMLLQGIRGLRRGSESDACPRVDPTAGRNLWLLAVATSIDAFAVGLSLALTNTGIVFPALVIGIVCAAISAGGVHLGATLSRLRIINRFSEILGGLALLGIGLNILRQSL